MKHLSYVPLVRTIKPTILLSILVLMVIGCSEKNALEGIVIISEQQDASTVVYETDSTEWIVCLFKQHLLYSEAIAITLPEPWHIPSREEAQILKTCTYANEERFVTCDGYTFGMPSASVSKAGSKTKYSLLGLYQRRTIYEIQF